MRGWLLRNITRFLWIGVLMLLWALFTFIWGFWTWGDDGILGSLGWWFAELGHVIFGMLWGLHEIYFFKQYNIRGSGLISGRRRDYLEIFIVASVAFVGLVWEILELSWDGVLQPHFFPLQALAQKGQADTIIDLILNPCGAFIAFRTYCLLEKKFYKKFYLDDPEHTEIDEALKEIQILLKIVQEKQEFLQVMKRQHFKERLRELYPVFRDTLRVFRKKKHPP